MITLYDEACVPLLEAARDRFMAKVSLPDQNGCMVWKGKRDSVGYGVICVLPISKDVKAHRMAWALENGPIPTSAPVIRHSCDNPGCVNPEHLAAGTQTENVADAVSRGRNSAGKGEGHRKAKLTASQVAEIRSRRESGETCASLGREFGVGRDQISRICTRKVWREVG